MSVAWDWLGWCVGEEQPRLMMLVRGSNHVLATRPRTSHSTMAGSHIEKPAANTANPSVAGSLPLASCGRKPSHGSPLAVHTAAGGHIFHG